ncbi:MAG: HEAT repeat domain-containing protein [Granulosicoccaceae bacterium]
MSVKSKTLAAAVIAVGGGFLYWLQGNIAPVDDPSATTEVVATSDANEGAEEIVRDSSQTKPVSPFGTIDTETAQSVANQPEAIQQISTKPSPAASNTQQNLSVSKEALAAQAYELGTIGLTDEQILDFTNRLKTDPAFLEAVANEFRSETDLKRLQRLSYLLGQVDDPALTSVANDMVYSGSRDSQLAGLELLKHLQPNAPQARDAVRNILSSDSDPEVIVRTINVLAMPAQVSDAEKQSLVDHLLPLTNSDSADVRQSSIAMITRWSGGDTANDVLTTGLNDTDEQVRKTAAYATIELQNPSPAVIEALFVVLENQNELPRARKGARLSLSGKQLSESNKVRLKTADAQMRKQYARKP